MSIPALTTPCPLLSSPVWTRYPLQGRALRRLIYTANTSSILQRVMSRDVMKAAVEGAGGLGGLLQAIAAQMEAQAAHSFRALAGAFHRSSKRDLDTRCVKLHPPSPDIPSFLDQTEREREREGQAERERERERDRQRDRQRDGERQTEGQAERQRDRQRDRQTEGQTERQAERQAEREREGQRERERETETDRGTGRERDRDRGRAQKETATSTYMHTHRKTQRDIHIHRGGEGDFGGQGRGGGGARHRQTDGQERDRALHTENLIAPWPSSCFAFPPLCRTRVARKAWRSAAVYGVLARRHVRNLLSCGPRASRPPSGSRLPPSSSGPLPPPWSSSTPSRGSRRCCGTWQRGGRSSSSSPLSRMGVPQGP